MSQLEHRADTPCGGCDGGPEKAIAPPSKWLRIATALVGGTMFYNIVEGIIATLFGSKSESIALFGFGLDSFIECAAAAVMLWHLSAQLRGIDGEQLERKERTVRRFIGGTFIALAAYILIEAGWTLWKAEAPEQSTVGMVLAFASLVIMPTISIAKLRAARELGSRALRAEAKETLVCSYLSFTLLVGLGANAWLGWWWADPIAALLMVPWLIREGREGLRGDECCDGD